jgi:predicted aconitase with swiveling domain
MERRLAMTTNNAPDGQIPAPDSPVSTPDVEAARIVLRGRTVVGGRAEGRALVTRQAIPGWGGVNPMEGVITETSHELCGVSFAGKVLVCRGAKGSSGWSAMYHTTRLAGTAPRALVFNEMTTKVALGAVVMRIPSVTDLDRDPLEVIETDDWVIVDGDNGIVEVVTCRAR